MTGLPVFAASVWEYAPVYTNMTRLATPGLANRMTAMTSSAMLTNLDGMGGIFIFVPGGSATPDGTNVMTGLGAGTVGQWHRWNQYIYGARGAIGILNVSTNIGVGSLAVTTNATIGGTLNVTGLVNGGVLSGNNTGDQTITLTGDVTGSGTGTFAATLANVITAGGPIGSATTTPIITWDAKGRLLVVSSAVISGVAPSGAAGGALVGLYPNPGIDLSTGTNIIGDLPLSNIVQIANNTLLGNFTGGTADIQILTALPSFSITNLTIPSLAAGRAVFTGTGGLLTNSADWTWNGTQQEMGSGKDVKLQSNGKFKIGNFAFRTDTNYPSTLYWDGAAAGAGSKGIEIPELGSGTPTFDPTGEFVIYGVGSQESIALGLPLEAVLLDARKELDYRIKTSTGGTSGTNRPIVILQEDDLIAKFHTNLLMYVKNGLTVGATNSNPQMFNVLGGRSQFSSSGNAFAIAVAYNTTDGAFIIGGSDAVNADGIFSNGAGTELARFKYAGRVSLGGNASPVAKLQVLSTATAGVPAAGAGSDINGLFLAGNAAAEFGLMAGVLSSGYGWIQAQQELVSAATYPLLLNPNGGGVAVNKAAPAEMLDVGGAIRFTGTLATITDGGWGALGFSADNTTLYSWSTGGVSRGTISLYQSQTNNGAAITSAFWDVNGLMHAKYGASTPTLVATNTVTTPVLQGGTAAGSSLVIKSTTAVGSTDSIRLAVGNNGDTAGILITNTGAVTVGSFTAGPQKFNVSGGRSALAAASEPYSLGLQYSTSAGTFYIGASNSATPDGIFSNGSGTELAKMANSGNVSIGALSAAAVAKLEVLSTATVAIPAAGAGTAINGLFLTGNAAGEFGMMAGVLTSGMGWLQVQQETLTSSTYPLLLNPNGGKVAIGLSVAPVAELQVLATATAAVPAAGAGTAINGLFLAGNAASEFGLMAGVLTSGSAWIQSQQETVSAATYPILLNPNGGSVTVGSTLATQKFNVIGGRTMLAAASEPYSLGLHYSSAGGAYYLGASNSGTPDLIFSSGAGTELARFHTDADVNLGNMSVNFASLQVLSTATVGVPGAGASTAIKGLFLAGDAAGTFGLMAGTLTSGAGWIQAQQETTSAATYELKLNPNGGTVSTGAALSVGAATTSQGVVNGVTGFQYNGTAVSGHFLKGNGTAYVDGTVTAADVGSGATLTAGAGLTGTTTGALLTAATLVVGAGTGITVNADDVAIDQSFSPTWTGTHAFTNTVTAKGLTVTNHTSTGSLTVVTNASIGGSLNVLGSVGASSLAYTDVSGNAQGLPSVRGSIPVGGVANWTTVTIGTTGKFFKTDGTDPSWQPIVVGDIGSGATLTAGAGLGGTTLGALLFPATLTLDLAYSPDWTGFHSHQANALGTTQDDTKGILLYNATDAAAGAQQISPALRWRGEGWKTDSTAASQTVDVRNWLLPVQGAANPSGTFKWQASINGGAYADILTLSTAGSLTAPSAIISGALNVAGSVGASSVAYTDVSGNAQGLANVRGSMIQGGIANWTTTAIGASGRVWTSDGTDGSWQPPASSGTVTSVALALPTSVFDISGSPVTSSGTLTATFDNQVTNTVFIGPASGSAAAPTFRALITNDIPSTALGSGSSIGTKFLRGDRTWQTIAGSANLSRIYSKAAETTIANTTTTTTFTDTGVGSLTIAGNTFAAGAQVRLRCGGYYTTKVLTPGTFTIQFFFGGTATESILLSGLPANTSSTVGVWQAEFNWSVMTIGASGTIAGQGFFTYSSPGATDTILGNGAKRSSTACDTTADQIFDIKGTWQTADALNSITCEYATMELMNN